MAKPVLDLLKPLLALALLAGTPVLAQNPDAYTQVQPDRFGTGKVFMGRQIAIAVGAGAADWLERPERAQEEGTEKIIPMLNLKPGDVVADIGAGTGYFSFRLAKAVPKGKVYAQDISRELLENVERRKAGGEGPNVTAVLGTEADLNLPPASIDLILMVDVWHEMLNPRELGQAMLRALKPGGRLALVEYRGEDADLPIQPLHRMTVAQARKEMAALGFNWVSTDSKTLPIQHLMIFMKP